VHSEGAQTGFKRHPESSPACDQLSRTTTSVARTLEEQESRKRYKFYITNSLYIPLWMIWGLLRPRTGTRPPQCATVRSARAPIGAPAYWPNLWGPRWTQIAFPVKYVGHIDESLYWTSIYVEKLYLLRLVVLKYLYDVLKRLPHSTSENEKINNFQMKTKTMWSGSKTRELPWLHKTGCLKCIAALNHKLVSTFDDVVVGRRWGLKKV